MMLTAFLKMEISILTSFGYLFKLSNKNYNLTNRSHATLMGIRTQCSFQTSYDNEDDTLSGTMKHKRECFFDGRWIGASNFYCCGCPPELDELDPFAAFRGES